MKRVKIIFPDGPPLSAFVFPLRIADINYGGHMGNDRVLQIAHEARVKTLSLLGFSEMDCGGHGLIMADAEIAFRAEAFYGESLEVAVSVGDVMPKSFSFYYRMVKKGISDAEKTGVAEVRTGMVAFDYANRKVTLLSEKLRKKICL